MLEKSDKVDKLDQYLNPELDVCNFDKDGFISSLHSTGVPGDIEPLLAAMSDDVVQISNEIEKRKKNEVVSHVLKLRSDILAKMAAIINEARMPIELDLSSDEVRLLLKFILTTMQDCSTSFFARHRIEKNLCDQLFINLAAAFEDWEKKFELFKASYTDSQNRMKVEAEQQKVS